MKRKRSPNPKPIAKRYYLVVGAAAPGFLWREVDGCTLLALRLVCGLPFELGVVGWGLKVGDWGLGIVGWGLGFRGAGWALIGVWGLGLEVCGSGIGD